MDPGPPTRFRHRQPFSISSPPTVAPNPPPHPRDFQPTWGYAGHALIGRSGREWRRFLLNLHKSGDLVHPPEPLLQAVPIRNHWGHPARGAAFGPEPHVSRRIAGVWRASIDARESRLVRSLYWGLPGLEGAYPEPLPAGIGQRPQAGGRSRSGWRPPISRVNDLPGYDT